MTENNIRCIISTLFLTGVQVFTSVRSDPIHECGSGLRGSIVKKIYELSDGVICQTPDALKWFTKKTQKKGVVIMNQIDDEFYRKKKPSIEAKNIVTAGRFVAAKNHTLLIEAFSDIADVIPENLVIYGDGELRNDYLNLINKLGLSNRIFLPGVSNTMIDVYDRAKLFVLSSDYEGLPNVLMEAIVREIPCVSTDCPCGGPRLLLDEGECGKLVPVNDKSKLADAMVSLLTDEELRSSYIEKERVRKNDFYASTIYAEWKRFITNANN